eukprot:gene8832-9011_t
MLRRSSNAWADLAEEVQSMSRSPISPASRLPVSMVSILGPSIAAGHALEGALVKHVPQVATVQVPPKQEYRSISELDAEIEDKALNNSYDFGSSSERAVLKNRLPIAVAAAGNTPTRPEVARRQQHQHLADAPLNRGFLGSSDIGNGYGKSCRGSMKAYDKRAPITAAGKAQARSEAEHQCDDNPFLAPAATVANSAYCSFNQLLAAEAAGAMDESNPFLRESLVYEVVCSTQLVDE